ncbi:hypothetical protein FNE76_06570 [Helicobacter mehlei]|uniref:Uncharacterized protein n=1 Tax=Helicobacter mehlei TaxID=2316080 RepID=A0A553UMS5_9HELI|nr:hypothetical protein [Helicobacter mehlei]TSA81493.1 hypothetical protein FNE76_06570 [Helicobacter mehlei]
MIAISDILLRLRSRLKDANYLDLRFSDGELIDNINMAASSLILEFKLNRAQKLKTLTQESPFLKVPHLLGILEAKFNNAPLRERTCEHRNTGPLALYVQGDNLSVTPFKEGHLGVAYSFFEPLSNFDESLPLPTMASDALLYGALASILEVPTEEQNPQKIGFYRNLAHQAKNQLALYLNRLYSTQVASKVIRI